MANLKAHIIAGAIILVVAFTAMSLFNKDVSKEGAENTSDSKYFIQVYSASYGENCHGSREYKKRDENGVREKVIVSVKSNNRLSRVSELCNEEASCVFPVNKEFLGTEKTYDCDPALEVKYRCFRMDKLQNISAPLGARAELDCRPKTVKKRMNAAHAKGAQ